jgi:serine/threonine-protein kinase
MKIKLIIAFLFLSFSVVTSQETNISSKSSEKKLNVGDIAEGGIVFYVNETGKHGLVCSLNNLSTSARWFEKWTPRKNERLSENFNTSTTIFGNKNNYKENQSRQSALKLCAKLKLKMDGEKYKDWYLPSKEELHMLYLKKELINTKAMENNGDELENSFYWSSTEKDYTNAWIQNFKDGKKGHYYKNYLYNVRAIRKF